MEGPWACHTRGRELRAKPTRVDAPHRRVVPKRIERIEKTPSGQAAVDFFDPQNRAPEHYVSGAVIQRMASAIAVASTKELRSLTGQLDWQGFAARLQPKWIAGEIHTSRYEKIDAPFISQQRGIIDSAVRRRARELSGPYAPETLEKSRATATIVPRASKIAPVKRDAAAEEKRVEEVVGAARANASVKNEKKLSPEMLAPLAKRLLGLNSGGDEVSESIADFASARGQKYLSLSAFDRAGFQVLGVWLSEHGAHTLFIDSLNATHGRDHAGSVEQHSHEKRPGQGNAPVIASWIDGLVDVAITNGYSQLELHAASNGVARHCERMGFVGKHGSGGGSVLTLDLTNAEQVKRLTEFVASRAGISDVPKNVPDGPFGYWPKRADVHVEAGNVHFLLAPP